MSDAEIEKAARGEDAAGAGGVRLARSIDEVREHAASMLGHTLVTKQTGIEGKLVKTLFVEQGCNIAQELYLSLMLDRSNNRVLLMASAAGGTEIEDVAEEDPDAIKKVWVHPSVGLAPYQAQSLAFGLGLSGAARKNAARFFLAIYKAYMDTDCSMLEIQSSGGHGGWRGHCA